MDTAHWPQEIVVKPMEEIVTTKPSSNSSVLERKVRPQKEQSLNCPRCNSTNTKFCYYNNYSLSQPRYFCKTCRRYWTEGGSLRNIPVGGGSRKNRRSSAAASNSSSNSNSSSSSSKKMIPDLPTNPLNIIPNPNLKIRESSNNQDLNLGFSTSSSSPPPAPHDFKAITDLIQVPNFDKDLQNPPSSSSHQISALELLNGITTTRGLSSFMSMPITTTGHHHHHDPNGVYSSSAGFAANLMPDFMKPSLSFSLDHGLGSNYGGFQGVQEAPGKLLFPFQDLKQVSNDEHSNDAHDHQQNRDDHQPGDAASYWNGVIGGGSW